MSITTAQIRGARGILNWSQSDLAERTGISATSIGSIENSQSTPRANTLNTIQKAFESSGIEFIGLDGVRLKSGDIRIFRGQAGLIDFYNDVYETVQSFEGEILVSNVDERQFIKNLGEFADVHIQRMSEMKDKISYKILIREGDNFLPGSSYAEYRAIPKDLFASVPFYVYADKLAIMLFDGGITVIMLEYPSIAQAYRIQFADMWQRATNLSQSAETVKKRKS